MSIGTITFGKWNNKPIEWDILKEDDFCQLIITKDRIGDGMRFSSRDDNQWKNSEIRQFLNGEFLNQAFTNEEKKKIVNVYLANPNATKDNVFLLDFDEANSLVSRNWYEKSCNNDRCKNCWWYRNPTRYDGYLYCGYPSICYNSTNSSCGKPNVYHHIRPALYLKK